MRKAAGRAALALVLLAGACTSGDSSAGPGRGGAPAPVRGGTLRVTVGPSDIVDPFDPRTYAIFSIGILRCCLARTLLTYNGRSAEKGGSVPRPDLAAEPPDVSEDGLTWTFRIRQGVHYAPPMEETEIVAQDFVRALEREAKPVPGKVDYAFYYRVIEGFEDFSAGKADSISGLETPDDHSLVVHLTEPTGDFGERMSQPATSPLPPGAADGHDDDYGSFLVSSGPYMIEGADDVDPSLPPDEQAPATGFAPAHHVTLVRNPSWERSSDPLRAAYPDRIEIVAASLSEKPIEAGPANRRIISRMAGTIQSGEADVALGTWAALGKKDVARYRASGGSPERLFEQPAGGIVSLTINLAQPPFDDVHVRRAVLLAADREEIRSLHEEFFAFQTVPLTHSVSNALGRDLLRSYDPYPKREGDPRAARREMRLSRYDDDGDGVCDATECEHVKTLAITALLPIVRSLNRKLPAIGVHLEPNVRDSDYYVQRSTPTARFALDVGAVYWVPDYPNPSAVLVPLLSQRGPPETNLNFSLMGASRKELESYGYDDGTTVPSIESRIGRCMRLLGQPQIECWNALDQYVTEEIVPYVPIATPASYFLMSPRVGGFTVDQLSFQPALDQLWVEGRVPSPTRPPGPEPGVAAELPQPTKRCHVDGAKGETLWFESADGTAQLDGAIVGRGPHGVVLVHQLFGHNSDGGLCEGWPFASYLADRGFKVLAFDLRCFGFSTCPEDARGLVDDVAGAVDELRRRGASSVSLVGADLGADAALTTAANASPEVSSVVALSPACPCGGESFELRPEDHVPDLDVPVLYAQAKSLDIAFEFTKTLHAKTGSEVNELIVEPASWGLGWDLLTAGWGNPEWSSLAGEVANFITKHSR